VEWLPVVKKVSGYVYPFDRIPACESDKRTDRQTDISRQRNNNDKSIGDDTKAADRQRLNCIKNKKK